MIKSVNTASANDTFLQGHITVSYEKLVEKLGRPMEGDDYKIDAEWTIEFNDGTVATIYNWKNGKNYCGPAGKAVERITEWNIGGKKPSVVSKVYHILGVRESSYSLSLSF